MATRIVHVSDLHFPARKYDQPAALAESIRAAKPDLLVVSGDLTRAGRRIEFEAAADFLGEFSIPKLVVPGNHDVPIPGILDRLTAPFRRFDRYFGDLPTTLETPDVFVVGFNSAAGVQFGLDWSLGRVTAATVVAVASVMKIRRNNRLGVVVCHHPLRQHAMDPQRSNTAGGPVALDTFAAAGMDLLLHGHLHRESCTCVEAGPRRVCELCANTALSDRERGGPAGYNIVDVAGQKWTSTAVAYMDGQYTPRPKRDTCVPQTSHIARGDR